MSLPNILVLAALIAGCFWCIAGDVKLFLTIYLKDAVDRFALGKDGFYRFDIKDIPSFRQDAWLEAVQDLCRRGLAMEDEGTWILTSRGIEMRKAERI